MAVVSGRQSLKKLPVYQENFLFAQYDLIDLNTFGFLQVRQTLLSHEQSCFDVSINAVVQITMRHILQDLYSLGTHHIDLKTKIGHAQQAFASSEAIYLSV